MSEVLAAIEQALQELQQSKRDFDNEAEIVESRQQEIEGMIDALKNDLTEFRNTLDSTVAELQNAINRAQETASRAEDVAEQGVSDARGAQATADNAVRDAAAAQNTANQAHAGKLKALDVAENGSVNVRSHDFRMGHSSRLGTTGRAIVDGTDNLVLNYGPDWEGGTIVHGELKARLWVSDEYAWHQGEPDVKMMPAADTIAFLTRVQGEFMGGGEVVRVYVKDGYWYLGGHSQQEGVGAHARCIGRP